jgi:glycosyltransferase involved in cell wall biosynthesis
MTDGLLISAVLCTYNRAPLLAKALGALSAQTLGQEQFEVVLIDDGSSDDTPELVSRFAPLMNLRYTRQPNSGLAAAKNHGICLSRAPIVVFIDDDDVLDSRALEQHWRSHEQDDRVETAILGYTGLGYEPSRSPLMRYATDVGCQLFSYRPLTDGQELDFTYFWGGRSSCKRELLLKHGLFDPVFRFGAEDIELAYRLRSAGLRVRYNAQAISTMIRTLTVDDFVRRCVLQGRSNWVFHQRHPNKLVRAWTQIEGAEAEWRRIAPHYPRLVERVHKLDRLANARIEQGLDCPQALTELLHRAYAALFRASRIKGGIERMREEEAIDVGRTDVARAQN